MSSNNLQFGNNSEGVISQSNDTPSFDDFYLLQLPLSFLPLFLFLPTTNQLPLHSTLTLTSSDGLQTEIVKTVYRFDNASFLGIYVLRVDGETTPVINFSTFTGGKVSNFVTAQTFNRVLQLENKILTNLNGDVLTNLNGDVLTHF